MNRNYELYPQLDTMDMNMEEFLNLNQFMMPGTKPLMPNHDTLNLFGPYQGFMYGNLFRNLYEGYQNYKPRKIIPQNEQEELLNNVDQLTFAAHELNLLLDVYPDNQEALQKFNQYRKMAQQAIEAYESKFGPLTVMSDHLNQTPWAWEETMFPWERGAN